MNKKDCILLTGGSGKIGKIFINNLLRDGYKVLACTRNTKHFANYNNENLIPIECDLTNEQSIKELITECKKKAHFPNVLINNARNLEYSKVNEHGYAARKQWLDEYNLDVVAAYDLSHALINEISPSCLNKIINISSIYGVVAANPSIYNNPETDSPIHYSVAKAALIHLSKEMAIRFASRGITVNTISYGGIEGRTTEEFKKQYSLRTPINRMLNEMDLYEPLKFLISSESKAYTGQNLIVDGGWTVW
jgi:NAD(P)-dependent dehydrogenase (short-subunit alcohol dehydrogenase family)